MIIENRRTRAHVDIPLILLVIGLSAFGVLAVAIATFSTNSSPDASLLNHIVESDLAMRQFLYLMIAPVVLSVMINLPFQMIRRRTKLIFVASCVLLLVVWVFNRAAGVKAWMDIIWGFTIQPSEFAKLSVILMMARALSKYDAPMKTMNDFISIMVQLAIPSALILVSGEMGSLLVILFMFLVMLWFSDIKAKTFWLLIGIGVLGILALFAFMNIFNADSYRLARIYSFLDPSYNSEYSYQQTQSEMAIGSGGVFGIGMFVNGALSQLNYVPADWTDFIYATIGEAFGFVGCSLILLVYLLIILRMLYLARYTRDKYGRLIIIGVMGMLLFHVFENIGMTIGAMPITGIPLPFLSYGGSNMVTNMGGIGLVLNVTKNRSLSGIIETPQRSANLRRFRSRYQ